MPNHKWSLPEDGSTSGFMEHRGNPPQRGEFNDQQLADAIGESVPSAHARIEDVTEHRSIDLDE